MPKLTGKRREEAMSKLRAGVNADDICREFSITKDAIRKWGIGSPEAADDLSSGDPASAALAAASGSAAPPAPPAMSGATQTAAAVGPQLSEDDIRRLLIEVPKMLMKSVAYGTAVAMKLPIDQAEAAKVIDKIAALKNEEETILGILSPFVAVYAGSFAPYAGPIALVGYAGTLAVGAITRAIAVRAIGREYWAAVHAIPRPAPDSGGNGSVPGAAGNRKDNADALPSGSPGA
jgi:hypothetical protein